MFASVRSVLASGVLLMCAARTTLAFVSQNAVLASATTRRATAVPAVSMHSPLQRVWDLVQDGSAAELDNVEQLMMEVDTETFTQATAWKKSYTSLRCVIAEVRDQISISVLVLPRRTKIEWQRHSHAYSISRQLFGSLSVCNLELQGSDQARKLEQQELEATYTDAWAVGGSAESDCVCRGGRCPRMWDCPFWVDRRRAEAKGSSAHVALRVPEDSSNPDCWRAGPQTVRRVEALEPSALLEVHIGPRNTRHYQKIESLVEAQVGEAVELIETLTPLGVKPGVGRYVGPPLDLREKSSHANVQR